MADVRGPGRTYVVFTVAGATYALRSTDVQHMEMIEHVTPVPNAAPFVEGVVLSRGQVVPVINLRARFGFERAERTLRTRLVVVETAGRRVGLLVDDAREFLMIPDDAVEPPAETVNGLSGKYLEAIATLGDRIVLILDVRELIGTSPTVAA